MKSGKIPLFPVVLAIVINVLAISVGEADPSLPVPTGQQNFATYGATAAPVISADPSQSMPIGFGSAASGGLTLDIRVASAPFSGPVDIYLAFFAPPIDSQNLYFFTSTGGLVKYSLVNPSDVVPSPWIPNTSDGTDQSFGSIPVSSLPAGTYAFYLLVTPAGSLASYYLWTTAVTVANNVLPVTVNGSLCSSNSYLNKPCVSITVCTPGTSDCETIDDILLDTGSVGLRLFSQVLTVSLPQATIDSDPLAECIQFGDGSSDWGPVKMASVILGNEPAVEVPVHVLDSTFAGLPRPCMNADQSPAAAGFNGILGVGLFLQDCGPTCANTARNGMYYRCSGISCSGTAVDLSRQVLNPVALLPHDNNGVIVQLPNVPPGGLPAVNGALILGIGTQLNNVPSGVTAYVANNYGEFTTTFNGTSYNSFIDSGSNGLFFSSPSSVLLPACAAPLRAWFCPYSSIEFSAINKSSTGSPSGTVSFLVGDFLELVTSSNSVFSEIGGNFPGGFDWGLPFYLGRNVVVGFEKSNSILGTGPFWAY